MKFETIKQLEKRIEEIDSGVLESYGNEYLKLKAKLQTLKQVVVLMNVRLKVLKTEFTKQMGKATQDYLIVIRKKIEMLEELKTAIQGK